MNKISKKYWVAYGVLFVVVSTVFSVGIFSNPGFDIHDFCMGLSTEIIGAVIALVILDRYATIKITRREELKVKKLSQSSEKESNSFKG